MAARRFYPANKHYSSDELKKIARELGWTVTDSRGTRSHALASKPGHESFIIPRDVSSWVQKGIKERLGLK